MNILFLTLTRVTSINESRSDYVGLMKLFRDAGHNAFIVFPRERRYGLNTSFEKKDGINLLGVKTLNLQKTNSIEKGIGTILFEFQFMNAIQKYFSNERFDLVIYSTPPITFSRVISKIKKNSPNVKTYLLLKDIFPQNAVDLGMIRKKSVLYRYFRMQETKLYKLSDYIGCMSPANIEYLLKNNSWLPRKSVELAPNATVLGSINDTNSKDLVLRKYGLPTDRPILIYGGNLGKPQGIPFMIKCLEMNKNRLDCFFLIVGDGTEYPLLAKWIETEKPQSVALFKRLPKSDYDRLVRACNIGLIFLDHRFTIPNFPSRLLSYLECGIPVIAATDVYSDVGRIAEMNGFGFWCESNDADSFTRLVDKMLHSNMKQMGMRGYEYLCDNYLVEDLYNTIKSHLDAN